MRVCLVSPGLNERNRPLQPWAYLFEAASALARGGHDVHLVSDGHPHLPKQDNVAGIPTVRLARLQGRLRRGNPALARQVNDSKPDVVFWHLGLTSFLRLGTLKQIEAPVIGILTSPVYAPRELLRLGFSRLLRGYRLSASHLLGLFVPNMLIRRALTQGLLEQLVVECETTRTRLTQRGVSGDRVHVIRPSVDSAWFEMAPTPAERTQVRRELALSPETLVVGYFGPPTSLRGLPCLLRAVALARKWNPRIRLLALSRKRDGELDAEHRRVQQLITRLGAEHWTHIVTGFLPRERLIQTVAACDAVALPFEIVPSDVPLSVLEAMALGVPVITTQVVCLPELVPEGAGLCVPPGDPPALAEAIHTLATGVNLKRALGKSAKEYVISWNAKSKDTEIWNTLLQQWTGSEHNHASSISPEQMVLEKALKRSF